VKKSNVKSSQSKIKRAVKNKKRMQAKPYLSKFDRKQKEIRDQIIFNALK
jgi:hypothetical protein